ncbi:MAG: hypothetical protein LJE91_14345 [Gammaproteobacteria bacterium]|jgi:hypothetical protein|nr:hypothetical protein [Gammaproteobacteria bacterium]
MNHEFDSFGDSHRTEEVNWIDSVEWSDEADWQIDIDPPADMEADLDLLLVELGISRSEAWEADTHYQLM